LVIRSRRIRWAAHVTRMGEMRIVCNILVGKPEGKRPPGRFRRGWEDNIRMDVKKIQWEGLDWIHLARDREKLWALVHTVMNLRVP